MQSKRKRLAQTPQRLGSCSRLDLPLLALLILDQVIAHLAVAVCRQRGLLKHHPQQCPSAPPCNGKIRRTCLILSMV
jgi:hypothetical protein